jgi:copper chaperone CopZ
MNKKSPNKTYSRDPKMNEKSPNKNRAREALIMKEKSPNKVLIAVILLFLSSFLLGAANIDPDVEIRIKGLVCPSCAIGLKNLFKKNSYVKGLKIDTKKGLLFLDYWSIEIHPSKIKKMVKDSGYEVESIKWLKKGGPNRYNKP